MGRTAYFFGAAALLALMFIRQADASTITQTFSVTATSGPLSGTTALGTFNYDSSSIVPGLNNSPGLLTFLDFTWNGITYNQNTIGHASLFFTGTVLSSALICRNSPSGCVVSSNVESWFIEARLNPFGEFTYGIQGGGFGLGTALLTGTAPEPSTLVMLGLALGVFALAKTLRALISPTAG